MATGDVQVSITEIDIQDLDGDSAWAPQMLGLRENATSESALVSFGMADFTFTQNGQELQLRDGMLATLKMDLPVTADGNIFPGPVEAGDVIPLWYYDDEAMIWKEEGQATIIADASSASGYSWTGQVSHFSTWNCDDILGTATVNVFLSLIHI